MLMERGVFAFHSFLNKNPEDILNSFIYMDFEKYQDVRTIVYNKKPASLPKKKLLY
jgi:hypothetical protein